MNLKALITELQNQRLNDSDAALKNIANSERYLQQAYEGRYLFELIQNVRDANKQFDIAGSILIELKPGVLIVSNTGVPFDERGINSITTIGDSPKESQEFIGFKGIGFKSVHEVSDRPHIVTKWGTVVFDKQKSKALLANRNFKDRDIPLFFIPHFHESCLTEEDHIDELVTKVILPLKPAISSEIIESGFNAIGIHQILLLGSLKHIELKNGDNKYKFTITEEKSGKVVITKNDEVFSFKHFKPSGKIPIPQSIIDTLEDKEREIYERDPFVDISLLFDLDENGRLIQNPQSKLFLFYPTEITSGFNFIIHSYFVVSPDRKGLRSSPLNQYILECVANYITGEWLSIAKKNHSGTFIDFLAFSRNKDAPILNYLYDNLIARLKSQKFIFDRDTKRYFASNEVVVADGFDKGLFPDNQLNGKRLIYVQNTNTRDWLTREFNIEYLSFTTIAENIEKECIRQRNRKNFKFFENLYRYLVEHDDLNLKERKVLLTSKRELLKSEDYVFYGLKEQIQFPGSVAKRINFIHPAVKISDQRQGKGQTGFVEYNTELLVRRLLRLYEGSNVPKMDILISLFKLNITERLHAEIKSKVLLPVKGDKWVNPIQKALYIESEELSQLYPFDSFIDMQVFAQLQMAETEIVLKLKQFGVWQIPGIYFSPGSITIYPSDVRFQYIIRSIKSFSTPYFTIYGDWLLDVPQQATKWFTDTVIANWSTYTSKMTDENNVPISYKSQTSDKYEIAKQHWVYLSGAVKYLREGRWIKIDSESEAFKPEEVVGIDPIESRQVSSLLFKKYLHLLDIHQASNISIISLLSMNHLDGQTFTNFKRILSHIHKRYATLIGHDKEFVSFYNKILSKLFDFYFISNNKEGATILSDCMWLGINDTSQSFKWALAKQLYYIDDKPAYDILPADIKQMIQPHFTNRDKNRFGQIGKKIGLNFKQVIEQRIVNIIPVEHLAIWNWLPAFSESIALAEVLLETNLDTKLEELKAIQVIVCESFDIDLYKDSKHTSTVIDVTHRIVRNDSIEIYVRHIVDTKSNSIFAAVLHDVLVEVLSRDLHTIRFTLNDFYSRSSSSKLQFLARYEVSPDRIEEIENRVKGISISKVQAFWLSVLQSKNVSESHAYMLGSSVDFAKLSLQFNIPIDVEIEKIDYDSIYKVDNLLHLQQLFSLLQLDVSTFNHHSELKIDFKDYFLKKLEGLRFEFRKNFEVILHDYFSSKEIDQKSSFQDEVDKYIAVPDQLKSPLLIFEYKRYFFDKMHMMYAHLEFVDANLEQRKLNLLEKYRANEREFRILARAINKERKILDEFIELNIHRSLLYFDGTIPELESRYRDWCKQKEDAESDNNSETKDRLSEYLNLDDATIEETTTKAIALYPSGGHSGGAGKGRRIDGGRSNPDAELSGIVGEKIVFEMLCRKYSNAEWVSRNAAKAGFNPEGSDQHACDIKYVDESGQPHYIEVKSSTSDDKHFFVTFPEFSKAMKEQDLYHFYLVLFSLDNTRRKIFNLKNIFMLEDGQEIFENGQFTANFSSLEIRFQ
jgi:hypothetical protein